MLRSILSVLAGMALWTVLWLGANAALAGALPGSFAADGTTADASILALLVLASVAFSVAAGYLTALLARRREIAHTVGLGIVQLAIGIGVQSGYWEVIPLWYHLAFLSLLLPGNVVGGVLRGPRTRAIAATA
jgi:hypothetical protein